MDQADHCPLPDGIFADNFAVPGPADILRQYAAGPWNHACGGRGAEDRPAVWTGQLGQSQYDERCPCHQHGGQYDTVGGQSHNVRCGMKENLELERGDIVIDRDMDVDCDIGQEITVYIETWFDVDKKFGVHTSGDEGTWLNMYGKFNPFEDSLHIECEISRDDGSSYFDYEPTAAESQLIKDMITEKIKEEYGQTPQEFCEGIAEGPVMGGM